MSGNYCLCALRVWVVFLVLMLGCRALCVAGVSVFGVGCRWMARCRVHGQYLLAVLPSCWLCVGVCGLLTACACGCVGGWLVWWVVCDLYSGCEHLFVLWFCLVLLGIRWMPWHQELMKDVAACDMPRGVGERTVIRGCPNGGT